MFRDVPECSGMFHVPGFIDALKWQGDRYIHRAQNKGRSTDSVRPDRGLDGSSLVLPVILTGHFWIILSI